MVESLGSPPITPPLEVHCQTPIKASLFGKIDEKAGPVESMQNIRTLVKLVIFGNAKDILLFTFYRG